MKENNRNIVVLTDSLSSVQSLDQQKSNSRPKLIMEILTLLQNTTHSFSVLWIPGHSGIGGNDVADQLAKEALTRPTVDVQLEPEAREHYDAVDRYVLQRWQESWDQSTTGAHARSITPQVSMRSRHAYPNRRQEICISRLRLGKCRLNFYLFKYGLHPTGLCDTCEVPETIEHFILDCTVSNLVECIRPICDRLRVGLDLVSILNSKPVLEVLCSGIKRTL